MIAIEDASYEQHFLFDCPLCNDIREQHLILFGSEKGSIRFFLERNADQMYLVAHYIHLYTCAFRPECPMSHIWLPTPDCGFQ